MNVTQLRSFISVIECGSFSEAARRLGISQPAVTMQLKTLEADVGATLLHRRYHRVELTEAGQALLPYARKVLDDLANAREEIAALSDTITGHLVIAASTTPGEYVIPRLLGDFLKLYPQVKVEITVHDTAEAVAAVAEGRADLGVCGAQEPSANVTFEELGSDEILAICSPGHPLSGSRVEPIDLAEADWVVREAGSGTQQVAWAALRERGIDPDELRVLVELGSGAAVVSAVEGGLGIAMVSRYVAAKALALGTVAQVELAGEPITRSFYAVLPGTGPTHAAAAFHAHVREALSAEAG